MQWTWGIDRGERRPVAWAVLGLGLLGWGCADGPGAEPVYPVRGRVTFRGQPASGAFVVFHRVGAPAAATGEPVRPSAKVGADGAFALTSFDENDGAPAGAYAVTVQWNKLVTRGNESLAGPNVIPAPYAKPESTPLKVTVDAGENALAPFELER